MSRLKADKSGNRRAYMVVLRNYDAVMNTIPQHPRRRLCHLPRGFANRDENELPLCKLMSRERLSNGGIREHGAQRCRNNRIRIAPERTVFKRHVKLLSRKFSHQFLIKNRRDLRQPTKHPCSKAVLRRVFLASLPM